MPLTLSFLIHSAPVTATSVPGKISNTSCGERKALTLISNAAHYKVYRFLTRGKTYPESRRGGREKEGSLPFIQLQRCPEILGSKKRTFTDIPLAQRTLWKHFLLPRYVLAREGGYQGTATYCHANVPSYWRDFPATAAFFHEFDPGIERGTKQLHEREAALA